MPLDVPIAVGRRNTDPVDDQFRVVFQQLEAEFLHRLHHRLVDIGGRGHGRRVRSPDGRHHLHQRLDVQAAHREIVVNFLERNTELLDLLGLDSPGADLQRDVHEVIVNGGVDDVMQVGHFGDLLVRAHHARRVDRQVEIAVVQIAAHAMAGAGDGRVFDQDIAAGVAIGELETRPIAIHLDIVEVRRITHLELERVVRHRLPFTTHLEFARVARERGGAAAEETHARADLQRRFVAEHLREFGTHGSGQNELRIHARDTEPREPQHWPRGTM
jgi:hypothetical protein